MLLGHDVAESTVAKYMVARQYPERRQSWRTFLRNHRSVTAASDFFTVPTLTFKTLLAFVVLSHHRRRIVHVAVTEHPTEEWTARQLLEAFPDDGSEPRFLLRDRDSIYGSYFRQTVRNLGIRPVVTSRKCPWQNPYAERVIGTLRRECTDHVIALGEQHLLRILQEYAEYYNRSRTHLSLQRNSPLPRTVACRGRLVSQPVLGGLHHEYRRAA